MRNLTKEQGIELASTIESTITQRGLTIQKQKHIGELRERDMPVKGTQR